MFRAKDMNSLFEVGRPRWTFLRMVSKGERHQLQEVLPRGRRETETRTGRRFAAGPTPVFKFLELAIKSYE